VDNRDSIYGDWKQDAGTAKTFKITRSGIKEDAGAKVGWHSLLGRLSNGRNTFEMTTTKLLSREPSGSLKKMRHTLSGATQDFVFDDALRKAAMIAEWKAYSVIPTNYESLSDLTFDATGLK